MAHARTSGINPVASVREPEDFVGNIALLSHRNTIILWVESSFRMQARLCSTTQMTGAVLAYIRAAIWITVRQIFGNIAGEIRSRVGIRVTNVRQNIVAAPGANPRTTSNVDMATVPAVIISAIAIPGRKGVSRQNDDCADGRNDGNDSSRHGALFGLFSELILTNNHEIVAAVSPKFVRCCRYLIKVRWHRVT